LAKLSILIAGGGGTVEALLRDPSFRELVDQVVVIESDPKRRVDLERLSDVLVIEGDASDASVYDNINMGEIDAVLALTNRDEVNFLVLAIASQYKVPIRIGVFKEQRIAEIVKNLKLGIPIVRPAIISGEIKRILSTLRSPIELCSTPIGEYKIYLVTVHEDDLAAGVKVEELNLEEDDAYILFIHNGRELIPPGRNIEIQPGYSLFILARDEKFLAKIKGHDILRLS
jgi:trk system potassium uptake protein TrkA